MKKILILALTAGVAVASGMATAADDPIAARKALMKSVGASVGVSVKMMKGEAPYDARVAMLAMRTINAASIGFGEMFPAGSETGGETTASPKIWSDMGGFSAKLAKFQADSAAAMAAPAADLDGFKAQFGQVAGNCKGCHTEYRVPKK
ncbi:MAG: cytochrome c [Rhizobiales bacterium]|nr:cytochrome c [Hyphomicrobiales bacterium]